MCNDHNLYQHHFHMFHNLYYLYHPLPPGYFNSTLNPVIYAMTNRDFKLAFIGILKKIFCSCFKVRSNQVQEENPDCPEVSRLLFNFVDFTKISRQSTSPHHSHSLNFSSQLVLLPSHSHQDRGRDADFY